MAKVISTLYCKVRARLEKKEEECETPVSRPAMPKPVIPIEIEGLDAEPEKKVTLSFSTNYFYKILRYLDRIDPSFFMTYNGNPPPDRAQNAMAGRVVGAIEELAHLQPDPEGIEKILLEVENMAEKMDGSFPSPLRVILTRGIANVRKELNKEPTGVRYKNYSFPN